MDASNRYYVMIWPCLRFLVPVNKNKLLKHKHLAFPCTCQQKRETRGRYIERGGRKRERERERDNGRGRDTEERRRIKKDEKTKRKETETNDEGSGRRGWGRRRK